MLQDARISLLLCSSTNLGLSTQGCGVGFEAGVHGTSITSAHEQSPGSSQAPQGSCWKMELLGTLVCGCPMPLIPPASRPVVSLGYQSLGS